jgi:hypothetical protein
MFDSVWAISLEHAFNPDIIVVLWVDLTLANRALV